MSDALEHVRYSCGIAGEEVANYVDQLQATVAELEEEIDRLESESEEYAQLQSRCFDGGGSHASVFDEVSELRAQLAAAQEENKLLMMNLTQCGEQLAAAILKATGPLEDQLATAEQRVAEACKSMCLSLVRKENNHIASYGPGYLFFSVQDVADFIDNGEWRKYEKMRCEMTAICISPACGEKCDQCNSALTKDKLIQYAKRYAWLREKSLETIDSGGVFAGMTPLNVVLNGDDLDLAIDAEQLKFVKEV